MKETIHCTRMIIYCRTYDTCGDAYIYFQHKLGSSWTYPTGTPDLPRFRLVDMFMSCTDPEVKEDIIKAFTKESSLRIEDTVVTCACVVTSVLRIVNVVNVRKIL